MQSSMLDQVKKEMQFPDKIRNMSVIAHVDHGKSTLTNALVEKAGLISSERAEKELITHTMPEEAEGGISIKSTGLTLLFTRKDNSQYVINLIDSPGHIDFSSEVTAALRITDGAIVVVDAIDGVCVQTETVLRQACSERIKSVLMINKIDRCILEKKLNGEDIYQSFIQTIDKVNIILSTYLPEDLQGDLLDPLKGNVAFGAGKECWAFRIQDFAKIYAGKWQCDEEKMASKLWGDNFYDPETKKWKKDQFTEDGKQLERGFVKFIMKPILNFFQILSEKDKNQQAIEMAESLGVALPRKAVDLDEKQLRKLIFSTWLNAADNLLEMVVAHLPSPVEAMVYRTEQLYDGPLDDELATAMKKCDPKGPLMMYISKMVPNKDYSQFYAFGRIYSGTLRAGQKVFIMGSEYTGSKDHDYHERNITMPVIMMGRSVESVQEVSCGNTIGVIGLDNYITKAGTITDHPKAYPIRNMKFSVSPVVRVAVSPKNPSDQQKFIDGLKKLKKSDPLVQILIDKDTRQNIIAGSGELHLKICLKLLEEIFARCEIKASDPVVSYRETVLIDEQTQQLFTKSANKHNKLFGVAQRMPAELTALIESKKLKYESQEFRDKLVEEFGWDREDVRKIWAFAPETEEANVLVDTCKQVQGLNFIKDSIINAFHEATRSGVLTGEPVTGFRFNITDAQIHSDPAHRGPGQVCPQAERIFKAGMLAALPRILEPMFLCEIQVPQDSKNNVYSLLNKCRAEISEEILVHNTPLCIVKSYLPVAESFRFTEKLREVTQGKALNQCVFDHWRQLPGDPYEEGTLANKVVTQIRLRKGMKPELPRLQDYIDKY